MPLWYMANKRATNKNKENNYQYQVGYMLNPEFNINKAFKEQVAINLTKSFSGATMIHVIFFLIKGTLVSFHF